MMSESNKQDNNKNLLENKEQKDQNHIEPEKNEKESENKIPKEPTEKRQSLQEEESLIKPISERETISDIIPEQKEKTSSKRFFGIDLIRVLSCYLVVQTHSGEFYYIDSKGGFIKNDLNIWPGIYNSLERVCVPLFIIISGYLLLPMKTDYTTFLKKRFLRISSPFIIFCILYDLFFYFTDTITLNQMLINIPKIFINYGTEIGHLWYIYMAMGIYLFIPIITPWIKTAEKSHFYYYFVLWGISLFNVYLHRIFQYIWGEQSWNNTSLLQSFIGNFGYAVCGAFIKLHLKNKNLYLLGALMYILGTAVTMGGYFYQRTRVDNCADLEATWHFNNINVAMQSIGLFLVLRKIECNNKYITAFFNDIALKSYGIYMIHVFFLKLYYYLFDGENRHPSWFIWVLAFPTFVTSYLVVKVISYIPYSQYVIG